MTSARSTHEIRTRVRACRPAQVGVSHRTEGRWESTAGERETARLEMSWIQPRSGVASARARGQPHFAPLHSKCRLRRIRLEYVLGLLHCWPLILDVIDGQSSISLLEALVRSLSIFNLCLLAIK